MAFIDSVLNLITKQPKDPDAPKPPVGSRSEREAKLKDKAGMVISVFALLLAVNKISCFIDCVEHNIIYVRFASRTRVQNAFTLKGLQQFHLTQLLRLNICGL